MANIRDIAREAGVGIATVSRYINGTGNVSEKNKTKIEEAIAVFNYKPNELARAIFSKNTKLIGLIVPNISNPYFNELASIIEEYISSKGYSLFLCNANDDVEKEKNYINILHGHRVAGIITVRNQLDIEYISDTIPVVSFEGFISEDIVTLETANYKGGQMAFEHLYENGCKKLLHIQGPNYSNAIYDRMRGFVDSALRKNVSVTTVKFETDFQRNMFEHNSKVLKGVEQYDGIFVFNDIAAAIVIRYCKEQGIVIPRDLQVIGFDNSYIGEFLYPSLTTIEQSVYEVGKILSETLIQIIDGLEIKGKKIIIEPKLIIRESTKKDDSF